MTTFNPNWDTSWTATSIDETVIADDASEVIDDEIDNDDKAATEVSITVTYGTVAEQGVVVRVLRDVNGTDFEDPEADYPWGFQMPYGAEATTHRNFTVPGHHISKFKVHILNESGDDVEASVLYKQATIDLT